MTEVAEIGFVPELLDAESVDYGTSRIRQALMAQGIPLHLVSNPMDQAALATALAMDSEVLAEGGIIEAMRSLGGLRDFMRLTDDERLERGGKLLDRIENDADFKNRLTMKTLALGAMSGAAMDSTVMMQDVPGDGIEDAIRGCAATMRDAKFIGADTPELFAPQPNINWLDLIKMAGGIANVPSFSPN